MKLRRTGRVYLAHNIRGPGGKAASPATVRRNLKKARTVGRRLRERFPRWDLYVPAEGEAFVKMTIDRCFLSIKDVLELDQDIIAGSDLLVLLSPRQRGKNPTPGLGAAKDEVEFATYLGIPVVYAHTDTDRSGLRISSDPAGETLIALA